MTDLNIKIPEAHELARELSEMTGESMARATTEAIRERRDRLARRKAGTTERLMAIARNIREELPEEMLSGDPTDELYDEWGLPVGNRYLSDSGDSPE
ncbi:MAG: type II toxin-antitoxin system VapB family antitoxin [Solirubrobacterales bacterium]|nr:type II toxin-antitoxin system VapB family antitoxin [Solirubrobacterales bacterium]